MCRSCSTRIPHPPSSWTTSMQKSHHSVPRLDLSFDAQDQHMNHDPRAVNVAVQVAGTEKGTQPDKSGFDLFVSPKQW